MSKRTCYIFAAGERTSCAIQPTSEDYIIAADGGYDYLLSLGLHADCLIGDLDSLHCSDPIEHCIRHPKKKDDTDLMLAVKYGLEKGYTTFAIYGGLGGRLDHTLGNIQTLTYLSQHGACGTLYGENHTIQVITNDAITFDSSAPENKPNTICSIFSLSNCCESVTIRGMEYEAEGVTLTNSFPLGISNTFLGKNAYIEVKNGTLAILAYQPS